MFNYKKQKNQNNRYNSQEYMPKIIEKMYNLGRSFSYEGNNFNMNYNKKINKLKTSTKELNNQIKIYREDLDKFYEENNIISSQLKLDYIKLNNELNNNINIIKEKIDKQMIEQKKFNRHIKEEFLDLKNTNNNIINLINNVGEQLYELNKKMAEKKINNKKKIKK